MNNQTNISPVVRTLESLLVQAREGKINSIAVAYTLPTGGSSHQWEYMFTATAATLIGEVAIMQSEITNAICNDKE